MKDCKPIIRRTLAIALSFLLAFSNVGYSVSASEYVMAPSEDVLLEADAFSADLFLPELAVPIEELQGEEALPIAAEDDFFSAPWEEDGLSAEAFDQAAISEDTLPPATQLVEDAEGLLPEELPGIEAAQEAGPLALEEDSLASEEDSLAEPDSLAEADSLALEADPLDLFTSQEALEAEDIFSSDFDALTEADNVTSSYIELTYNGSEVVSTVKTQDATLVPSNGAMTEGWYYLGSNVTKNGRIELTGTVHLILGDGYTLDTKGIYVPKGSTLYVYGQSAGTGKIYSHPSGGSAIGGFEGHDNGSIEIHGGVIEATGAKNCAGIGSNSGRSTEGITIYGGNITATGGSNGAGIGAGRNSDGGTIRIYGGTITATGKDSSAGIGGGDPDGSRADFTTIEIYGGNITSTGNSKGAGIGGGEYGSASITISGGRVTANGGSTGGAGIGSGADGTGSTIRILGGTIEAYARDSKGYAIGNGKNNKGSTSQITLGETGSKKPITITAASYGGKVTLEQVFKNGTSTLNLGSPNTNLVLSGTITSADAQASSWGELQDALSGAANRSIVVLSQDYTAGSNAEPLRIPAGKTLTIDLNGKTLNRNLASAAVNGSVLVNEGTLTITDNAGGGKITGGWSAGSGGGIYNSGSLTIRGGTISGNKSEGWGGGIYLPNSSGSALHLFGGSITGNTCAKNGGGVHVSETATIKAGAAPVVSGNFRNTVPNNINLAAGALIGFDASLTAGASLYVSRSEGIGKVTTGYAMASAGSPADTYFHPDNTAYNTFLRGGEVYLDTFASNVSYKELSWNGQEVVSKEVTLPAVATIPDSGKMESGWYYLNKNLTIESRISLTGDTSLILGDDFTLDVKGLYIPQGSTLTIYGQAKDTGALYSHPDKGGAAIGATRDNHPGGAIVIHGGNITAIGDDHCAGIGSNDGNGTTAPITIYGGTIKATGGSDGAGIGGGRKCDGGNITIYGGKVTAENLKEDNGAGIGGGKDGNGGTITIYGGEITTYSKDGAGIGGGAQGKGGTINIHGGQLLTYSSDGAGIGGGEDGDGGTITITGGFISARDQSDAQGARIGGGNNANGGVITISGGEVRTYLRDGAGIGGGEDGDGGSITITGGEIYCTCARGSTNNGAGIGGGNHSGDGGHISITGGYVYCETLCGAGIGGGRANSGASGDGGTIEISGGRVEAICAYGFAIGAGGDSRDAAEMDYRDYPSASRIGSAGTITISGDANVTASGHLGGIGGSSGSITINAGTVKASGNQDAGCGLILLSNNGRISLNGGMVTANGLGDQPAISLEDGTVLISGGTVTASAEYFAIGGRSHSTSSIDGTLNIQGEGTVVKAYSEKGAAIDANSNIDSRTSFGPGITVETYSPGKGDKDGLYEDRPIFYDQAKILVGSSKDGKGATYLPAGERKNACQNKDYTYMRIEPCEHPEGAYETTSDTHKKTCSYCSAPFAEEAHQMAEGVCQVCGFHGDGLVAIHFEKGESATGTMQSVTIQKDGEFTLPACSFTAPQGLFFTGWKLGDSLLKPGDVITATEDITLTALWTHTHEGIEFLPWTSSNALPTASQGGKAYYLTSDVTLQESWTLQSSELSLCLAGHTIKAEELNTPVLSIEGGTLTLFDEEGGKITQTDGRAATVLIGEKGALTLHGGTIGNETEEAFPCVEVNGKLTMTGGKVAGEDTGVFVSANGTFTVSGDAMVNGSKRCNVFLEGSNPRIHIAGKLADDALFGLSTSSYHGKITEGLPGNGTAANFFSDFSDVIHVHEDGDAEAYLEEEYIVTLKAGEATGEDIILRSSMRDHWGVSSQVGKFYYDEMKDEDAFRAPDCPFPAPEGKVFTGWLKDDDAKTYAISNAFPAGTFTLTAQWGKRRSLTWAKMPDFASWPDFVPEEATVGEAVPAILQMDLAEYNAGTRLVAIEVTGNGISPIRITKDLMGSDLSTSTFGMLNFPGATYRMYTVNVIMPDADITITPVWEMTPTFTTHSLVLSGLIGVNFFMNLPDAAEVDYSDSYMEFSISGKDGSVSSDSFNPADNGASGSAYGFTCYVNSIQMADEITATFHYGDGKTLSETYSVAQYVKDFEKQRENFDAATIKAVEAIADYGHFMQPLLSQFRGWTIGTDHAEMPGVSPTLVSEENIATLREAVADHAFTWDVGKSQIADLTFNLTLDSSTTLRIFLTPEEGYTGEITAYLGNGTENVAVKQANGTYLVTIPDIPAHMLGQKYLIHGEADGEYYVTLSALTYINAVLDIPEYSGNMDMLEAMYALYQYYQAVMDYRAAH